MLQQGKTPPPPTNRPKPKELPLWQTPSRQSHRNGSANLHRRKPIDEINITAIKALTENIINCGASKPPTASDSGPTSTPYSQQGNGR
ncbi:hypothetical protein LVJ83_03520 [Uruburuella testudinis]|uniref:Uncharacterized protein n=1 Tax=Uruburuella testudinis TaxID=1282863 RepID=A0ABY4DW86_9NEIS|nr:hypothetical protein [Uruburuella testudinis]UOO83300.1 hypothetical protein LVJ83_03520 [Uruburuella testudinis]